MKMNKKKWFIVAGILCFFIIMHFQGNINQKLVEIQMGQAFKMRSMGEVNCYMYNNVKGQTDSTPNNTATGEWVFEGGIAISQDMLKKNKLRFGDRVYIPEFEQIFIVNDTMNKRHGASVDIFIYDLQQAKDFGKHKVHLYQIIRDFEHYKN